MAKKAKLPADTNKRAKSIVDIATGEENNSDQHTDPVKSAAALLGKQGGLKGGNARAKALTAKKRQEIAKKAAAARWKKKN